MEATCASETWFYFQRTTPRYIPDDRTLQNHRCENLKSYIYTCILRLRRVIAQAARRRLTTATALVRPQLSLCGIGGGQSDTGAGFLPVLRFPLPILTPPTAPYSLPPYHRCFVLSMLTASTSGLQKCAHPIATYVLMEIFVEYENMYEEY
jgi:hypothetical protein